MRCSGLVEGDYVETAEGLLFAVKGLFHPEGRVIAYLRYVPDPEGDRDRGGRRYRRVYGVEETTGLLEAEHPEYLSRVEAAGLTFQAVPRGSIARVYRPRDKLRTLMARQRNELEETLAAFASALASESGVPLTRFGVSGSVLIDLASPGSDIDLIVYGVEAGREAYDALRRLREASGWIIPYDARAVGEIVRARWGDTGLGLEALTEIEVGKVLHGRARGVDYFVRLVKDPEEIERELSSRPLSEVRLRAVVTGARDSIFTPCAYQVRDCVFIDPPRSEMVSELASFRGKFTEQAAEGDAVEARGTLEEVTHRGGTAYRVMLGKKGDYLIPIGPADR